MVIKRKSSSDVIPGQDGSNGSTKRVSLGWGSSEKYHQQGQDLARKGKFAEAIQLFTDALLQKNANTINIMDSRSAIYCKMGMYEKALSDAKVMIRADGQDERGYLRAGKALLLSEKAEKALDVYAYALKSLGERHPQREAVARVHTKLSARLLSRQRDPIQSLHNDCLLEIFQHIPFRQIVTMTRVSKTWRSYIKNQPSLWNDISFKGSKTPPSPEHMRACIHNSQNRVKRLQLHNMRSPLNAIQQASRCPRLEHLDIDGKVEESHIYSLFHKKYSLKTIILSQKISISRDTIIKLTQSIPNIERLEAHWLEVGGITTNPGAEQLPSLKALVLDMKVSNKVTFAHPAFFTPMWIPENISEISNIEDPSVWSTYYERVPKLEELRLSMRHDRSTKPINVCIDKIYHPNLRTIDISNLTLYGTWKWPSTLQHLRLINCIRRCYDTVAPLGLPSLKTLVLSNLDWLDISTLVNILSCNDGSLETLQIELCELFKSSDLLALAEVENAIKNVRALHLHGMGLYNLTDAVLINFIKDMQHLKELHVPYTRVTGSLIRKIVQWADAAEKSPQIEILNLRSCEDVSYEAVEWGRTKGLTILRS